TGQITERPPAGIASVTLSFAERAPSNDIARAAPDAFDAAVEAGQSDLREQSPDIRRISCKREHVEGMHGLTVRYHVWIGQYLTSNTFREQLPTSGAFSSSRSGRR